MQWNGPAKGWNAGAPLDDANFNRRRTIRAGPSVSYAQVRVIGFDGPINLQSLRLRGLSEAGPAVLNGTPLLTGALFGSGRREFATEVSWDLPSLVAGTTANIEETGPDARRGAAQCIRRCLARYQQHRLRARLPCVVEQRRAHHGAECQRNDGRSRCGVGVVADGEAAVPPLRLKVRHESAECGAATLRTLMLRNVSQPYRGQVGTRI